MLKYAQMVKIANCIGLQYFKCFILAGLVTVGGKNGAVRMAICLEKTAFFEKVTVYGKQKLKNIKFLRNFEFDSD